MTQVTSEPIAVESDIFEVIGTQRALRRLKTDPVPEAHIKRLIWAATRAPSGGNSQPWRFVVVTDSEKRKRLGELYLDGWNRYVKQAYTDRQLENVSPEQAAAMERTLRFNEDKVTDLLAIPDNAETAALIPVGWPKGRFGPGPRLPVEAVTYWDQWGARRQ